MQVYEFDYNEDSLSYDGELGNNQALTELKLNKTSNVMTNDDATEFKHLYKNIKTINLRALCDLNYGLLATTATLNALDKQQLKYTVKDIDNKKIINYDNAITVLTNCNHALKNGFIGEFFIAQKQ